jgi:hypothetical protein
MEWMKWNLFDSDYFILFVAWILMQKFFGKIVENSAGNLKTYKTEPLQSHTYTQGTR